jgi:hypothetical protein
MHSGHTQAKQMKLSTFQIQEAFDAGDYLQAAIIVSRELQGAPEPSALETFKIFELRHPHPNALVPYEIRIWCGRRCWYWNDLEGFGDTDFSEYDYDPVEPQNRICASIYRLNS